MIHEKLKGEAIFGVLVKHCVDCGGVLFVVCPSCFILEYVEVGVSSLFENKITVMCGNLLRRV
nr:hypothetical protein [Candidatus Baldrarchaeota archaeon]